MCVGGSGGGCCSDGRSFDGSRGSGHPTPTRDEIRDNLKVCEYGKNVLNALLTGHQKYVLINLMNEKD